MHHNVMGEVASKVIFWTTCEVTVERTFSKPCGGLSSERLNATSFSPPNGDKSIPEKFSEGPPRRHREGSYLKIHEHQWRNHRDETDRNKCGTV